MLTTEQKTIDGLRFQLQPMPVLKAARLDKKVLALLAPVLGGFKGSTLDSEIDLEAVGRGVAMALQTLPDSEFTGLLKETLDTVVYLPEGGAPIPLESDTALAQVFTGKLDLLYKVVMEVMRFNRFTPFALMERGGGLLQILGSEKETGKARKGGLKLGQSANLAPT